MEQVRCPVFSGLGLSNNPLVVDQDAVGQPTHAIAVQGANTRSLALTHQYRVGNIHILSEFAHCIVVINGYPDYFEVFCSELLPDLNKVRDLSLTGRAPCGPEINQQNPAIPF